MIKQSDEPIGLTCGSRARKTELVVARSRMRVHSKRRNVCLLALSGRCRVLVELPKDVEHWSLTTLREKLIKIGAKVVRHGRYITFQLAEVAIPRTLFAEILASLTGCGQRLYRHDGAPSSSTQIARQDRCVARRRGHALSTRNDRA